MSKTDILKRMQSLKEHWKMLAQQNPQVAPVINHCINDLKNLENLIFIPNEVQLEKGD